MELNNNILNELNIVLSGELKIKTLVLPFLFRASDINSYSENLIDDTSELKGDNKYSNSITFIKENFLQYIDRDKIELNKEVIEELDLDLKLFNCDDYKKLYTLKDTDGLYLLFTKLDMADHDYFDIVSYVRLKLSTIRDEIITIVHLGMENGRADEHLSNGFMDVQAIMEFSSSMIFHENQGKSGDMWSHREVLLRRAYISRKYESEKYLRERLKNESNRGQ